MKNTQFFFYNKIAIFNKYFGFTREFKVLIGAFRKLKETYKHEI